MIKAPSQSTAYENIVSFVFISFCHFSFCKHKCSSCDPCRQVLIAILGTSDPDYTQALFQGPFVTVWLCEVSHWDAKTVIIYQWDVAQHFQLQPTISQSEPTAGTQINLSPLIIMEDKLDKMVHICSSLSATANLQSKLVEPFHLVHQLIPGCRWVFLHRRWLPMRWHGAHLLDVMTWWTSFYNKRKRGHSTLLFYFSSVVRIGGACARFVLCDLCLWNLSSPAGMCPPRWADERKHSRMSAT